MVSRHDTCVPGDHPRLAPFFNFLTEHILWGGGKSTARHHVIPGHVLGARHAVPRVPAGRADSPRRKLLRRRVGHHPLVGLLHGKESVTRDCRRPGHPREPGLGAETGWRQVVLFVQGICFKKMNS